MASTVQRVRDLEWSRFLVAWAGLFHATVAFLLVAFPYEQLHTTVTGPVFELASPAVWSLVFLGGALSLGALWLRASSVLGHVVLMCVLLTGGAWLTTFLLAVVRDGSSPVALVVWFFLYVPFLIGIGKRASGKR